MGIAIGSANSHNTIKVQVPFQSYNQSIWKEHAQGSQEYELVVSSLLKKESESLDSTMLQYLEQGSQSYDLIAEIIRRNDEETYNRMNKHSILRYPEPNRSAFFLAIEIIRRQQEMKMEALPFATQNVMVHEQICDKHPESSSEGYLEEGSISISSAEIEQRSKKQQEKKMEALPFATQNIIVRESICDKHPKSLESSFEQGNMSISSAEIEQRSNYSN